MPRSLLIVSFLCLSLAPLGARAQPRLVGVASVGLSPFNNGRLSADGSILPGETRSPRRAASSGTP
jgi:hypothetical protein